MGKLCQLLSVKRAVVTKSQCNAQTWSSSNEKILLNLRCRKAFLGNFFLKELESRSLRQQQALHS